MTPDLKVGARYMWKGFTVVLKHLDAKTATISPEGSSHVTFASLEELAPLPHKGESQSLAMQISDAEWTRAVELEEALREVPGARNKAQAMQRLASRFKVSTRSLYTQLKKVQRDPSPHALLRANPGRRLGSRVLDDARERIIREEIEAGYLKPERPGIPAVHGNIKIACERAGLPPPCLNTVRARIHAIDLEERITRREGRKRANERCKPASGHLNVLRPLERVEIDHTLVDVILVSRTKPRIVLGRPWLTIAIDCYTRMVVGFYVSFDRPSSTSVALALAHAFLPKEEWLRRLGIPGIWPTFGFPEAIWMDNALEFRAVALLRGCQTYGVKACYRPPGEPQVGGTIERLIGTMMGRVHLLPGTTHSNVQQRADYDSEGRAQLDLRQFTTWLTSEIVTRYHTSTHRGIGKPPLAMWNQAFEGVSRQAPGAPLEVLASFLPGTTRVLRRTGVELHCLNYWSNAFSAWVGEKRKVTVHDYPLDADHVYVRLPNGELTQASVKNPTSVSDMTVLDHLLQARHDRQLENDPVLKQMRHDGHDLNNAIVAAAGVAKKAAGHAAPKYEEKRTSDIQLYRPTHGVIAVHLNDWS